MRGVRAALAARLVRDPATTLSIFRNELVPSSVT
jgi:hypothetical protein